LIAAVGRFFPVSVTLGNNRGASWHDEFIDNAVFSETPEWDCWHFSCEILLPSGFSELPRRPCVSISVSPYLTSVLSRLQSGETATASSSKKSAPSSSGTTTAGQSDRSGAASEAQASTLSDQVIGALVAMQMGDNPLFATMSSSTGTDPVVQAFASPDTSSDARDGT
jgi:hypothetical protein